MCLLAVPFRVLLSRTRCGNKSCHKRLIVMCANESHMIHSCAMNQVIHGYAWQRVLSPLPMSHRLICVVIRYSLHSSRFAIPYSLLCSVANMCSLPTCCIVYHITCYILSMTSLRVKCNSINNNTPHAQYNAFFYALYSIVYYSL